MPIRVECDSCGKVLNAKDDAAGKKAKCPGCGIILEIPATGGVVEAEYEDAGGASYDDSGAETKPCPACGEDIKKNALKCRFCGEIFDKQLKKRSGSKELAGLGARFVGAFVDGFISIFFVGPGYGLLFAGNPQFNNGRENEQMMLMGVLALVAGGLLLLGLQIYFIATRSQTIGKIVAKTRIMDIETNQPANFVKIFLLRGLVNGVIGAIPCIGPIYSIVDVLCIFAEDRRCLHDKIAGTYVADVS